MLNTGEDILNDIDATLEQLICNADIMKGITDKPLLSCEVTALQKTQESLMARLIHMQDLLEKEKKIKVRTQKMLIVDIQDKLVCFGKLNAQMIEHVETRIQSRKTKRVAVRPCRKKSKIS